MPYRRYCGVYEIVNTRTGHRYVGGSTHVLACMNKDIRLLRIGTYHSRKLQAAWNEDEAAFTWRVVEQCDETELIERKQWHMDQHCELNEYLSAKGPHEGARLDQPEMIAKLVANLARVNTGRVVSEATRAKLRKNRAKQSNPTPKGTPWNPAWAADRKAKQTIRQTGRKLSAETKEKIRLAHLRRRSGIAVHREDEII